jgi:hypothetical protein
MTTNNRDGQVRQLLPHTETTFYRCFPAKDDLVVAYRKERNQKFWELFEVAVSESSSQPRQ